MDIMSGHVNVGTSLNVYYGDQALVIDVHIYLPVRSSNRTNN